MSLATIIWNVITGTVFHKRYSGVKNNSQNNFGNTININEKALGNELLKVVKVAIMNSCFQVTKGLKKLLHFGYSEK
jgi:hypothetical protein